ncbi:MAG: translocation/assembly module TamB domain-containing protein [Armatimonadetes bacterium]|nr:translocation/assembly module TamB domain-containing protein [Armatimonadota bacterium]MDE2207285.1 translocation/assembly module TamB domain-containing protein [Armatimonadota bacterium]
MIARTGVRLHGRRTAPPPRNLARLRLVATLLSMVLGPGLVGLAGLAALSHAVRYVANPTRLANLASREASVQLGRSVRIGRIDVSFNPGHWRQPGHAAVTGLSIASGPGFPALPLVGAGRIDFDFSVPQLLASDLNTPWLQQVTITRPRVVAIRNPSGVWNFSGLFKKQAAQGRPVAARVLIVDGAVVYRDDRCPDNQTGVPAPFNVAAPHVNGVVDLRPGSGAWFAADIGPVKGVCESLHATGIAAPSAHLITASLVATAVPASPETRRFMKPSVFDIRQGTADIDANVAVNTQQVSRNGRFTPAISVSAHATPKDITLTAAGIAAPFTHVSGTVTFVNSLLSGVLAGSVAGAVVHLHGSYLPTGGAFFHQGSRNGAPAQLALAGTLDGFHLARIAGAIRTAPFYRKVSPVVRQWLGDSHAAGSVQWRLQGPVTNLTLAADSNLQVVHVRKWNAKSVKLALALQGGELAADMHGQYAGGPAAVRLRVETRSPGRFTMEAHGSSLSLGALGIPVSGSLSGVGDIDAAMTGQSGRTPSIVARAHAAAVHYNGIALRSLFARATSNGRVIAIQRLRADDPKGVVIAAGTVDLKRKLLDLTVNSDELNLAAVSHLAVAQPVSLKHETFAPPISGFAYLRSRIDGPFQNLQATGKVVAFGVQTRATHINIDRVATAFNVTRRAITLTGGDAERYPGDLVFSAVVTNPFAATASLDASANARGFDVGELLRTAGIAMPADVQLAGEADASGIHVLGPINHLRLAAPAELTVRDARLNDLPLDIATAGIMYQDGAWSWDGLLKLASGSIRLHGGLSNEQQLSTAIAVTDINLDSLANALPANNRPALSGILSAQLAVRDQISHPVSASGSVAAAGLAVNGIAIGDLSLAGSWDGANVTMASAALTDPSDSTSRITATNVAWNTATGSLSAAKPVIISHTPVSRIRKALAASAFGATSTGKRVVSLLNEVTGSINGQVAVSGSITNPVANVRWNVANLLAFGQPFAAATGSAEITRTAFLSPSPGDPTDLIRFAGPVSGTTAPELLQAKSVAVEFGGSLNADIDAYHVDLGALQAATNPLPSSLRIRGTADLVGISASGTTKSPVLDISAALSHLAMVTPSSGRTWQLDNADIGHIHVADGGIVADDITLSKLGTEQPTPAHYVLRLRGSVGFNWQAPWVAPDAPLKITADFPQQSLQILQAFGITGLHDTTGTAEAHAQLAGTRAQPELTGEMDIHSPNFRIGPLATGLKNLNGVVSFEQDHIQVVTSADTQVIWRGKPVPSAQPSHLTLTGSLPLGFTKEAHPVSGLQLRATNLFFDEPVLPGLNSGAAKGLAQIALDVTGSARKPVISGSISVHDGQIVLPSDFGSLSSAATLLPAIPAFRDVTLNVGNNVSMSGMALAAKVTGALMLVGTPRDPRVNGRLRITSGKFTLPTARFTVDPPGLVDITYPVYASADPQDKQLGINVNLTADTFITASSISGVNKRYHVFVTAKGPLTGEASNRLTGAPLMQLALRTDPPDLAIGQANLASKLAGVFTGINSLNSLSRAPGDALAAEVLNVFQGSVLPSLFDKPAKQLGFQQLELNYDPIEQLSFTASRRLFGPFYANYMRSLTATRNYYDLKVSMKLRNDLQLSWETDDQRTDKLLVEGIWKF